MLIFVPCGNRATTRWLWLRAVTRFDVCFPCGVGGSILVDVMSHKKDFTLSDFFCHGGRTSTGNLGVAGNRSRMCDRIRYLDLPGLVSHLSTTARRPRLISIATGLAFRRIRDRWSIQAERIRFFPAVKSWQSFMSADLSLCPLNLGQLMARKTNGDSVQTFPLPYDSESTDRVLNRK